MSRHLATDTGMRDRYVPAWRHRHANLAADIAAEAVTRLLIFVGALAAGQIFAHRGVAWTAAAGVLAAVLWRLLAGIFGRGG